MRLDTNYKEKKEKGKAVRNTNAWRLKKLFLNNQQVTDEIKRGNQIISGEKISMKTQPMRCSQSSSKREVYSNTILPQGTRKTLNG